MFVPMYIVVLFQILMVVTIVHESLRAINCVIKWRKNK